MASAVGFGVDSTGLADVKKSGVSPQYAQTWVGTWVKHSGWNAFEDHLATARDNGATPVILWYYWGDGISPDCVRYGCNGRTKGEWDSMSRELATRARNVMGDKPFIVVLEPEFNKNGVQNWESFDGHLADQAYGIKAVAPNAKITIGFGHWGGWSIFDRAVAASDYVGYQWMRGSTRDSVDSTVNSADRMLEVGRELRTKFGKDMIVYDLAIASYGNWEWVQEKALQNIYAKRGEFDAIGVKAIVWRYVHDNKYSSGYYGEAESTWGVKYSWGGEKPAYDDLMMLLRSGASSSPSTGGGGSTGGTVPANPFSNVQGGEWWIQASVAGSPTKVETRVNGGAWKLMEDKGWGWATSTHAPNGATVDLRATYGDGTTRTASYRWPDATPISGGSGGDSTSGGTAPANPFSNVQGGEWWIQASVAGSPAKVETRVNGGSWKLMEDKGWGWATSTHAPNGATVDLRATYGDGTTRSASYRWPDATPISGGSGGSAPANPFSNVQGGEWWIQASVAGSPIKVETRVNGGAWVPMENKGWGWAVSTKAPTGSTVELKATYGDGSTRTASYKWPVSGGGSTESGFKATFRNVKLSEWWVQLNVDGTESVTKVEVRVNGGAWKAMEDKGWGWATSTQVKAGSKVEFRATAASGATDVSGAYWR